MIEIQIKPIGFVRNNRVEAVDDNWSTVESVIELSDELHKRIFELFSLVKKVQHGYSTWAFHFLQNSSNKALKLIESKIYYIY